jgi:hypothetical protein
MNFFEEAMYLASDVLDVLAPEDAPALLTAGGVIASALGMASVFTQDDDGMPEYGQEARDVQIEADELGGELQGTVTQSLNRLEVVRSLIVTDPNKLTQIDGQVATIEKGLDAGALAAASNNVLISTRQTAWPALLTQAYKMGYVANDGQTGQDWCCVAKYQAPNWVVGRQGGNLTCLVPPAPNGYLVYGSPRTSPGVGSNIELRVLLSGQDNAPPQLLQYAFGDPFDPADTQHLNAGINPGDLFSDTSFSFVPARGNC